MEETQMAQGHIEQVRRVGGGVWDKGLGRALTKFTASPKQTQVRFSACLSFTYGGCISKES